jgi:hypothetical protein
MWNNDNRSYVGSSLHHRVESKVAKNRPSRIPDKLRIAMLEVLSLE